MLSTVLRRYSWCYTYFVWLCAFYYGAFHVESCFALCPHVVFVVVVVCFVLFFVFVFLLFFFLLFFFFSVHLVLWSSRLGKRQLVSVLLRHLFVYFSRVIFLSCFLMSGVKCGLWLWHSLDFSINLSTLAASFVFIGGLDFASPLASDVVRVLYGCVVTGHRACFNTL